MISSFLATSSGRSQRSATQRPGNRAFLLWCIGIALAGAGCRTAPLTIRAGLLLDGRGGQMRDAVITVQRGRIRAVGPWVGGAVTHDLSRYTVLPGFIDAHVHISGYLNRLGKVNTGGDRETPAQQAAGRAANALATLRAGFTTVASMGAESDKELRDRINRGSIPGPRVLTSLDPFRDPSPTPAELRRSVRRHKLDGADFIKVFNSKAIQSGGAPVFGPEQLAAICGEARRVGLRTVVHAMSDASLEAAVTAGCDEVEHGSLASAEGLGALAAGSVLYDPQCGLVLRNYLEHRSRVAGVAGFDSAAFVMMEGLLPKLPLLIRTALATPRLRLVYGTDAVAGAHGRNAEDLVCRVREAGQTPMDALVTATSGNAGALGLGREIGTIATGYRADLIALEGNPLQEIEAVLRVRFVMRGGVVLPRP